MNTNISAGTIARLLCLILALVNQVLVMTGHSVLPIENETIALIVTNVWTVAAALWSYWKNNSWRTRPASNTMKKEKHITIMPQI